MGTDFLLNVVAIPAGREPDWDAAARRIDALGLEDLDGFFRYWDHDGGSREEATSDLEYVPRQKLGLRDELDSVRRAFGHYSRQSTTFEFRGFRFLATGGESVGSVPTSLYESLSLLHAVGALEAAGFVAVTSTRTRIPPSSARRRPERTAGCSALLTLPRCPQLTRRRTGLPVS